MATYFHGNSEIQGADGLQTLVLMNPGYAQYSDAPPQPPGSFMFLNPAANNLHAPSLHDAPPQQTQQFVGIPQHEPPAIHGFAPPQRVQYNLWSAVDQNAAARETPRAQQGLSLSLSSQQAGFGSFGGDREVAPPPQTAVVSGGSPSPASGVAGIQGVFMSSKYLRAAQELLDEVVNVGNNNNNVNKSDSPKKSSNGQSKTVGESSAAGSGDGSVTAEASGKSGSELSMVERQEIQMKKAKLITMLDEVEQRYRQYHHQMQVVTSSFEQVAGAGSAKTYTALALQTISKQFRCLKDAISGQLRACSKSLGEEDHQGGSRLRFVDHTLRQQRALQQLGMIQHNAWRPQRGLPERSVSVLRAWLFEHFLHPYPKDSDKHMLAKQTGLTRSQVSNWFINARVRLWKPMVEEMYMEELKDQQHNASDDKTSTKADNNKEDSSSMSHDKASPNPEHKTTQNHDDPSNSPIGANASNNQQSLFTLIGSSELEMARASPKKPRQGRDEYPSMGGPGPGPANFIGGFGQYPIGEIGRFEAEQYPPRFSGNSNNGVSLTLGLPHSHQSFLPDQNMGQLGGEQGEFGSFDGIEIQNRKRFAAQLLPDFVA